MFLYMGVISTTHAIGMSGGWLRNNGFEACALSGSYSVGEPLLSKCLQIFSVLTTSNTAI